MIQENKKEKITLEDFLKQEITIKIYQLIIIVVLSVTLGVILK